MVVAGWWWCIMQSLTSFVQLMPLLFHKPFTHYCELCVNVFFFPMVLSSPTLLQLILHLNALICLTSPELLSSRIPTILESFTDWS